ncbi:MAG: 50S ribosomal protein L35 [Thermoleophilia bacterium]|nr:50S ribosomal protein L35 [Thermoleophilia bacterium]MDH3725776.1 50S ribosomal protein L35 [Thermoleophilia bacterium]
MPKMKTRRSAKKRFKITPTGKVKFQRAGMRHNLEKMRGKDKRHLSDEADLAPEHTKRVRRMLGKA